MPYRHTNSKGQTYYLKGQTYYLHGKEVTLQNGRRQQIYYFARAAKAEALDALPPGGQIIEAPADGPALPQGRQHGTVLHQRLNAAFQGRMDRVFAAGLGWCDLDALAARERISAPPRST